MATKWISDAVSIRPVLPSACVDHGRRPQRCCAPNEPGARSSFAGFVGDRAEARLRRRARLDVGCRSAVRSARARFDDVRRRRSCRFARRFAARARAPIIVFERQRRGSGRRTGLGISAPTTTSSSRLKQRTLLRARSHAILRRSAMSRAQACSAPTESLGSMSRGAAA